MADFGFYPEAKDYVDRFIAAKPTPADCAAIIHEQGTASLLRLDRVAKLDAKGRQMVEMILDGAAKHARDPDRLDKLAAQVADGSPTARREAIIELAEADRLGAAALVAALADAERNQQHAAIRDALVALEKRSIEPLVAALDSPDPTVQAQAAECLGRIGDRSAVFSLLAPALAGDAKMEVVAAAGTALHDLIGQAPSRRVAQELLAKEAQDHLQRRVRQRESAAGQVTLWQWDSGKRRPVASNLSQDSAQAQLAARLARDLYRINPELSENRRLYVVTSLEHAKLSGGLDQPLRLPRSQAGAWKRGAIEAAAMTPEVLEEALATALDQDRIAAAIAICEILGQRGSALRLYQSDSQPVTLVDAARYPDRRVRFAAAAAVMKLNPISPYAGSSFVAEAVADLVTAAGRPRAMVAGPRADHAQSLAGLLSGLGYETVVATSGRECVLGLSQSADYEFLLLDAGIGEPTILWVHDALGRDRRTARLPIGLVADQAAWEVAQRLARHDSRTLVFPQAQDEPTIAGQVRQLMEIAGANIVPADVRLKHAETALGWMAATADNPHGLYDWRRHESAVQRALGVSKLTSKAAAVLAKLGTHSSQRSLVELASQHARPLAVRQAAAAGFAQSVPRFGVQLTTDEIAAQYERYNQSREFDVVTQRLLAAVLDAMERKSEVKKSEGKIKNAK
jgi:hypothetical protein